MTPRFVHPCRRCVHIGDLDADGTLVDVYACPQHGIPTVVLRHGDGFVDYQSGEHLRARLSPAQRARVDVLFIKWTVIDAQA